MPQTGSKNSELVGGCEGETAFMLEGVWARMLMSTRTAFLYKVPRMSGLNQTQLFESGTSTIITGFAAGPREGVKKNSSGMSGDVRTLLQAGQLKGALQILNQQVISGDSNTYVRLLQECIKMKYLAEGKQVHTHIIQSGFKPNTFLLNTLVNMYAKCGSMVDAHQVFEKMPERDIFTWNILIAGYAKHGCVEEAFEIYDKMIREGVAPDKVTFICILNACTSLAVLHKGREVHANIDRAGVAPNIILDTALVAMYGKCGSVKDAREVFDNMAQRNVVSWTAMIAGYAQHGCGREAFVMYDRMVQERVAPNKVTYICILNACASLAALGKGREVHADIMNSGIAPDVMLNTTLVDMYAKCGSIVDARRLFNNMAQRNVISWNAMIAGYAQNGCGMEALEIYEQMIQEGVRPNTVTFICVLNVCASLATLENGIKVHADIEKCGLGARYHPAEYLGQYVCQMWKHKGCTQVFDNMTEQNVVSWSAMIAGYAEHSSGREAIKIYKQMIRGGSTPNKVTFISVLNACASLADLEKGIEVHADIMEAGIVPDIILDTALVDMYAKCRSMKDARLVFDNMVQRDVVSWNAMIAGYAQHGFGREAFRTYEQMRQERVTPNKVTYICILNACASLPALGKGREVHADIMKAGIEPDIILDTTLVDMYAKCGSVKDARHVLDNMAQRNVGSCNAMIAGYGQHGCGRGALELFEEMQQEGLKPDRITFICVLSACSHVGLVDEGCHYFDSMKRDHGLTPTVEHFGCMVDLLGRAGRLGEAEDFIRKMAIKPDAGVWGALLGACRVHGDLELAEGAAKCLFKGGPHQAAHWEVAKALQH